MAERLTQGWITARVLPRLPWIPIVIIGTALVMGAFAPWLAPHSPYETSLPNRFQPPVWDERGSWAYPLGTDSLGRDMLSRLLYGARISLLVALFGVLAGGGTGLAVGLVAGYRGGRIDATTMQLADATLTFPAILVALLLAVVMGPSVGTVVIAIGLVLWARFARVVRGEVLTLKERDFVALARIAGCSSCRILTVHILPNVLNTFMVLVSLNVGFVIILEATLSFLGAGIPPPTPSWGQMTAEGREYIATAWWISLLPGAAVGLLVLSLNLLGDWLRDTLDPRLRQL